MLPFWVTTSWDDGHPLDLRIAELLEKYKLKGTFYVSRDYMAERLTDADIRALSTRFEIGVHTLTHPKLTQIPLSNAKAEIANSQQWLETLLGNPMNAFCYPRGLYNSEVRTLVAEAGFRVARTVEQFRLDCGADFLSLPTTLHVYPFPLRPVASWRARFQPIYGALPHLFRLGLSPAALRSWPALAMALLKRAAAIGGVWHLWGHSWEIEKYGMWRELEAVFSAASAYPQAQHVTNSELAMLTDVPRHVTDRR
ncbi:MAG: polysaccharide deacetylase family protein [Aggregatilineales bacterium]